LFLHYNALAHQALATQKKLAYLGFQCLDHPPYSPDLAQSEKNWKKQLKFRHFPLTQSSLLSWRPVWTDNLLKFCFFLVALQKLEQEAKKFIELRGEYVE
jgi:transposase